MRHLLVRSVAVVAVIVAAATLVTLDADGEAAHSIVDQAAAATGDVGAAQVIKEISLASIEDASAWNSPGGSSQTSMMVSEAQKAAIRRQLDLLGAANVMRDRPKGLELSIGARLPREKTRLSPLPSEIARIVPRYGAYEYFLTESGALIIVDPSAYEIVEMIGA